MKTKKEISLIVLNYNGRAHLEEYFTSVYKQSLVPDEIIMMDNMSTDGSIEFVKQKSDELSRSILRHDPHKVAKTIWEYMNRNERIRDVVKDTIREAKDLIIY